MTPAAQEIRRKLAIITTAARQAFEDFRASMNPTPSETSARTRELEVLDIAIMDLLDERINTIMSSTIRLSKKAEDIGRILGDITLSNTAPPLESGGSSIEDIIPQIMMPENARHFSADITRGAVGAYVMTFLTTLRDNQNFENQQTKEFFRGILTAYNSVVPQRG